MSKRLTVFVAVFAALLSVTLSVQADNYNYYWTGASDDSNYLTTENWNVGAPDGDQATVDLDTAGNNITAYMYNTTGDGVTLNNSTLGASVYSLNIGQTGGTGTAQLTMSNGGFTLENGKSLSLYNGGVFTYNNSAASNSNQLYQNGPINISGGSFNVSSAYAYRIGNNNATTLNISSGDLTVSAITYVGVSANGTIVQTGGTATFDNTLSLSWGTGNGTYNLSGGTLETNGIAGLWCAKSSGYNTFNVSGNGTANFNKDGDSFTIGLYNDGRSTFTAQNVANVFTLSSGTVNAKDNFSVQYKGTLNVTGGNFNANSVTVGNYSKNNSDKSNFSLSGGTVAVNSISIGEFGVFTHSGGTLTPKTDAGMTITGDYTLGTNATLKPNGTITVSGTATLNGTIDLSAYAGTTGSIGDSITLVSANAISYPFKTNNTSYKYPINIPDKWITTLNSKDNPTQIKLTYNNGAGDYYWTGYNEDNLFFTGRNWSYNDEPVLDRYIGNTSQASTNYTKNCYIYSTGTNKVNIDYSDLGVASLTVGEGAGTTKTATVYRDYSLALKTVLTINEGGTAELNSVSIQGGVLNLNGGTLKLGGNISNSGSYTINLAGGTLATNGSDWSSALNATVKANTVTAFAPESGKTITWSGNFIKENDSRGTIRKTGAGTLALNSTNNNAIDANLTIDGGTVILNNSPGGNNRFAEGVTVKVNSGGTLQCNSNTGDAIGWGSNAVTFELYGGELAIQSSPNETLINKTVKLKGGSITTLSNNKLDICNNGNVFYVEAETGASAENPTTSYINGWLRLRNTDNFNINVAENAKLVVNKDFGVIQESGTSLPTKPLVKQGAGVLVFEGANTYELGTIISAGKLVLAENGTLGTGNVENNAVLEFAHSSDKVFSNVISGSGSVTKTGAGVLDISGANTYTNGTTITNGTLRLRSNGSLGTGAIAIGTNGTLTFAGDMTPQPKTITNAISGTGTIVKQGASDFTVNLDGNLTGFSGNMIISGGTLSVLMNGTNRSLNVTNLSGSGNLELRLASGNGNTSLPNLTNNGFTGVISLVESGGANGNKLDTGYKSFDGFTFNINSGTTIYVDEAAFGANVNLSGTGNNEGHGALRLHSNMTGNITVMENNSVLGIDRTAVTVSGNITSGADSGETTLVIKNVVDNNGSGTFTGVISDGTSGSKLGVQLSGGRHTFSGANTYTGMTTVSAGVLELTGDAVVANGPVTVDSTGTLVYEVGKDGNNQPITKKLSISEINKIVSTGQVIKTGDGTLQLYSAAQGLIDVSSLTVSSGRVDLKGYMTGGITVDANGVFSPGNSVGEATFGGDYILYDGATLLIEMDNTGIDKLTANSFDLSDGLIQFENNGIPGGSQYDILHATGNTVFNIDDDYLQSLKNSIPDYMTLSVVDNGKTVRLSIDRNAVPEPSTWALLLLGAAGLLYWRKRK